MQRERGIYTVECWNFVPLCSMLFNLTIPSKPHLDILSVLGKSCGQSRIIVMGGHVIEYVYKKSCQQRICFYK